MLVVSGILILVQTNDNLIVKRPGNNLTLNLLGDASIISINYERFIVITPALFAPGKLGLGHNKEYRLCFFGPCTSSPDIYLTIPHHFTLNLGKKSNFFEFGLGGTIINGNTTQNYLLYPVFGLRTLPFNSNKINFRIYLQFPFSGMEAEDIVFIPVGLSLGLSI